MKTPQFRGHGTKGPKVDLTKSDSKPVAHRPQVIKRRAVGPEWIAVVARRHRYCVPSWRIRSTALGKGS
jgi:hypothetical protein